MYGTQPKHTLKIYSQHLMLITQNKKFQINYLYFHFIKLEKITQKTNTKSNLLSTPSIVTMDNEEAYIVVGQNVPLSFLRGHSQERRDQLSVIFRVHGDCEFHKFPGPAHRIPLRPERVVNINQLMLQLPSCEGKTLLVAQIATYQMDEFTVTLRNSTWRNFHG